MDTEKSIALIVSKLDQSKYENLINATLMLHEECFKANGLIIIIYQKNCLMVLKDYLIFKKIKFYKCALFFLEHIQKEDLN